MQLFYMQQKESVPWEDGEAADLIQIKETSNPNVGIVFFLLRDKWIIKWLKHQC